MSVGVTFILLGFAKEQTSHRYNDWYTNCYFYILFLFIHHLHCFSVRKGTRIYEQMKQLGSSLDWSRACFTLDPVSIL